jgi:hypothetical protein
MNLLKKGQVSAVLPVCIIWLFYTNSLFYNPTQPCPITPKPPMQASPSFLRFQSAVTHTEPDDDNLEFLLSVSVSFYLTGVGGGGGLQPR